MNRMLKSVGLAAVCAVVVAGQAWAAPADAAGPDQNPPISIGELAQLLAQKLGLWRMLPANPTPLDCMQTLANQGVFPAAVLAPTTEGQIPGWSLDPDRKATLADLAFLIVRALGLEKEVQGDINDPQNWLDVLKMYEIPYSSVQDAVGVLTPLGKTPMGQPFFQTTVDPLDRRYLGTADITGLLGAITWPNMGAPATTTTVLVVPVEETAPPAEKGKPKKPVTGT